jgi:hypothetical protein
MILVELDIVTIWWVRQETLPITTFEREESLRLYRPSYCKVKICLDCGYLGFDRSKVHEVCIVTGLWAGQLRNRTFYLWQGKRFFTFPEGLDQFWGPLSLLFGGYQGHFG